MLDESTVRKKLKEYESEGIIISEKRGRKTLFRRADDVPMPTMSDVLDFFSEISPCGVIGSFLLDKQESHNDCFSFKHHYITGALDSDVLAVLFTAMRKKCEVTLNNLGRHANGVKKLRLIPLRVFISVQNGRQHLIAYQPEACMIRPFRIDYLSDVVIGETCPRFDELRDKLDSARQYMWGVNCGERKVSGACRIYRPRRSGRRAYRKQTEP